MIKMTQNTKAGARKQWWRQAIHEGNWLDIRAELWCLVHMVDPELSHEDREDLTHDVLAKMQEIGTRQRVAEAENPRKYVIQVIRNLIWDRLRESGAERRAHAHKTENSQPSEPSPLRQLIRSEAAQKLNNLLELKLSERQRKILHLFYVEGFNARRIAKRYRTEMSQVFSELAKIRKLIRNSWSE